MPCQRRMLANGIAAQTRGLLLHFCREAWRHGGQPTTTIFHVAPSIPTGYAQVLEEGIDDPTADGRLQASEIAKTFTLGLDVIAQPASSTAVLFLLYDGHGSTQPSRRSCW